MFYNKRRKVPIPKVPTFDGDRSKYWFITKSVPIAAASGALVYNSSAAIPLNCPSTTNNWTANTTGSPVFPYWHHSRVVKCVVNIVIRNRPSQSTATNFLEPTYVATRMSEDATTLPANTVSPYDLGDTDPRWKIKSISPYKDHTIVVPWHSKQQMQYDLTTQEFSIESVSGADSSVPSDLTFLYVVVGNESTHAASVYNIPEWSYQVAYLVENWERKANTF